MPGSSEAGRTCSLGKEGSMVRRSVGLEKAAELATVPTPVTGQLRDSLFCVIVPESPVHRGREGTELRGWPMAVGHLAQMGHVLDRAWWLGWSLKYVSWSAS